jgi:hypothetical protein
MIDPRTNEPIKVKLDASGLATITVPLRLVAAVRVALNRTGIPYRAGNSLFDNARSEPYTTITLPRGVSAADMQAALDAAP